MILNPCPLSPDRDSLRDPATGSRCGDEISSRRRRSRRKRINLAFRQGRGPNAATKTNATNFLGVEGDPSRKHTSEQKETIMHRFSGSMITVAIAAAAVSAVISATIIPTSAQAPAASGTALTPAPGLKTPWSEPDLQGIWTDETDTPLQRSPRYANQEFFTAAQREELDRQRSALLRRDKRVT